MYRNSYTTTHWLSLRQVPTGAAGDRRGETHRHQEPCVDFHHGDQSPGSHRGNFFSFSFLNYYLHHNTETVHI